MARRRRFKIPTMRRRRVGALSGAGRLLLGETDGLAIDFTDPWFLGPSGFYGSVQVKDSATLANNYYNAPTLTTSSYLTYTSPSVKLTRQADGVYRYQAHNLLLQSEAFQTTWSAFGITAAASTAKAPPSDRSALSILTANNNSIHYAAQTLTGVPNATYTFTVDLAEGSHRYAGLHLNDNVAHGKGILVDLRDGTILSTAISVGSAYTYVSSSSVPLGNGWYRISLTCTIGASSTLVPGVDLRPDASNVNWVPSWSAVNATIYATGAHLRRAPSNSTYLATTSAARFALPYEWDASGNPLGILAEEARTNLCLYSSNLTNAAWTASNITTAKTATGPDGVTNSATTLTASAGNGTILQAITSASAARITFCFIKRRTGTGTVEMTQDNGSTWTAVTVTSGWTRVEIASVTSANPTVGFRIVTSGDAVDVALFQHTTGAFATSPIETFGATATRAADNITLATSAFPYSSTEGAIFVEHSGAPQDLSVNRRIISLENSGSSGFQIGVTYVYDNSTFRITDLATPATKNAVALKTNDFAILNGGAAARTGTGTFTGGSYNRIVFGSYQGNSSFANAYLKRILYVPRRMSNAELQTLTS